MTYRGTVRKGVVILDGGVTLAEGTAVEVHAVDDARPQPPPQQPTVWQSLAELNGTVDDLPEDAARNVDHYLYRLPKRDE
jgi:hypothetical protein